MPFFCNLGMARRDLGLSILNPHGASREDDDDLKTKQRIRIGRFLFTKKSVFAASGVALLLVAAAVVCAVYLPPLLNKRAAVPVAVAESIRILVIGDSGVGNETQMAVARQMSLYASNQSLPFHALLHVGDVIYMDGNPLHFYDRITVPYLSPLQAREFVVALGNHDTFWVDGGAAMLAFANMTSRYLEKVFRSSDGTSMQLIVLDSNCLAYWWRNPSTLNETLAAEQTAFLDSKLAEGAYTWRVVSFHHPVFSCGRQNSTVSANVSKEWMPVINKRGNVNLVLSGHSHK